MENLGSIDKRMARGAVWMVGLRMVDRGIAVASTVILARLLLPEYFGLVAIAMTMVGLVELLGEFGFELALIQKQNAGRKHYDTAWSMSVLRGVFSALLLIAASKPAAIFFDEPQIENLIYCLAIIPLFDGFINIGTVEFRKHLTFQKEFLYRFTSRFVGFVITVVLAFIWRDYWALAVGTIAARGIRMVLSYAIHPYRPRFNLSRWRSIMGFSKWILATAIFTFANRKGHTLALGRILDSDSVGLFTVASDISSLASANLTAPIKRALFPGFSKLASQRQALVKAFLSAFGIIALLTTPISTGIAVTADLIVPILLGHNWEKSIPLLQLLAIAGMIAALRGPTRPVYLALGVPKVGAYVSLAQCIVYIPLLIWLTISYGMSGAACALIVSVTIAASVEFYVTHRLVGYSFTDLLGTCWRALFSSAAMAASVLALGNTLPTASTLTEEVTKLLAMVTLGVVVYFGCLLLLWYLAGKPADSAEVRVINFVRHRGK